MPLQEPRTQARWVVLPRDPEAEQRLVRELRVSEPVAALLVQRGLGQVADAEVFLRSGLEDLHDPRLLPDYEIARDALLGARERGDLIFVHGDYDVDGVTSAAIFDRFLKKIGCNVLTHVPHRMREGYGIHESAVEAAIAAGAKLFLTCDCGTGAIEQIATAREAGMTVVVTDHHALKDERPNAHAFINPHREDSQYPFTELCGAGVVFKLCAGLTRELGFEVEHFYRAYLDLAVLGTIADVMPLIGENRIIAKHGLRQLGTTKKAGLIALKQVSELVGDQVTPHQIGFVLGPRLNATGRIDDASISLQLLLENDPARAMHLAKQVDDLNRERKEEQKRILEEALELAREQAVDNRWVMIVAHEGWHAGVVGIVASRLVEEYNRPAFVLSINPETGMVGGSGRSIDGFNLAETIYGRPELMSGGGHAKAAGIRLPLENLEAVRQAFDDHAHTVLSPEDLVPTRRVDLEFDASDVSLDLIEQVSALQPFGMANPEPVFMSRGVKVSEFLPCSNPEHMRMQLATSERQVVKAICFNLGLELAEFANGTHLDFLFKPGINEWRGRRSVEWKIQDFMPSEA